VRNVRFVHTAKMHSSDRGSTPITPPQRLPFQPQTPNLSIDFSSMVASFGTGHAPVKKPTVENTPRVAPPPHRGPACEEVTFLVDGVPQTLEVVRQERIHGQEAYWCCPR